MELDNRIAAQKEKAKEDHQDRMAAIQAEYDASPAGNARELTFKDKSKLEADRYAQVTGADSERFAAMRKGLVDSQKRQEEAAASETAVAWINATQRGFGARMAVMKEQHEQELHAFTGNLIERDSLRSKQFAEETQLQRDHGDELAAMDSQAQKTRIEISERGLARQRDILNADYEHKLSTVTNQREIDKINRQWKLDDDKLIADDARRHADTMRNLDYQALETAAQTAQEREAIREKQIRADALAAGESEAQANDLVNAQKKIFQAQQDQEGRAAHLALHPYESYLKHKAELDAKVGHGGYTNADEAKELTREWRSMQGPAGQFFSSGDSRWKAIQTQLLNPQDNAAETAKATNQMAKDIRALLTGGLKLTG